MTQCVFMFIFLMLVFAVCSLATQKFSAATALFILPSCPWSVCVCLLFARAWPGRDENTHTHHIYGTMCFGLFVKISICLFVLCQHCTFPLLVLPGLFKPATSAGVTQHGENGEDDQRSWPVVIWSRCFEREQHKKWCVIGLEKYLEEYFSCGKNVWRPERSCGICVSDANNIEILYLGNTHTHTQG